MPAGGGGAPRSPACEACRRRRRHPEEDAARQRERFLQRPRHAQPRQRLKKKSRPPLIPDSCPSPPQRATDPIAQAEQKKQAEKLGAGEGGGADEKKKKAKAAAEKAAKAKEDKKKAKEDAKKSGAGAGAATAAPARKNAAVGMELGEFVHPALQIKEVDGKGRGWVVKENNVIRAGTLLLVDRAFAVGRVEKLTELVEKKLEMDELPREADREDFWKLSDGSAESERLGGREDGEDTDAGSNHDDTRLAKILETNSHATSLVDTYKAPTQVTPDPERGGLWLKGAYVNHGCIPTVQRVICDEWLVVRACRDMRAGDELLDSYCKLLEPVFWRDEALQAKWGFSSVGGHESLTMRSRLERACFCGNLSAVSAKEETDTFEKRNEKGRGKCAEFLDEAASAGRVVDDVEAVVCKIDNFCLIALAETLKELFSPASAAARARVKEALSAESEQLKGDLLGMFGGKDAAAVENKTLEELEKLLSTSLIAPRRMMELREGFSQPADATEARVFAFQQDLWYLLLASFGGVFRAHCLALKEGEGNENAAGMPRYGEQHAAWSKLDEILRRVIPFSELHCEVLNERLNCAALAYALNFKLEKVRREGVLCLDGGHLGYCAGSSREETYQVWRKLSERTFAEDFKQATREVYCDGDSKSKSGKSEAPSMNIFAADREKLRKSSAFFSQMSGMVGSSCGEDVVREVNRVLKEMGPVLEKKEVRSAFAFKEKGDKDVKKDAIGSDGGGVFSKGLRPEMKSDGIALASSSTKTTTASPTSSKSSSEQQQKQKTGAVVADNSRAVWGADVPADEVDVGAGPGPGSLATDLVPASAEDTKQAARERRLLFDSEAQVAEEDAAFARKKQEEADKQDAEEKIHRARSAADATKKFKMSGSTSASAAGAPPSEEIAHDLKHKGVRDAERNAAGTDESASGSSLNSLIRVRRRAAQTDGQNACPLPYSFTAEPFLGAALEDVTALKLVVSDVPLGPDVDNDTTQVADEPGEGLNDAKSLTEGPAAGFCTLALTTTGAEGSSATQTLLFDVPVFCGLYPVDAAEVRTGKLEDCAGKRVVAGAGTSPASFVRGVHIDVFAPRIKYSKKHRRLTVTFARRDGD